MRENKMDKHYKLLMRDVCYWLVENAREASQEVKKLDKNSPEGYFAAGCLTTFQHVISHIQNQAEGFQLDLDAIALNNFDPYKDL